MREKGIKRDDALRQEAEDKLSRKLNELNKKIEAVVPSEALQSKVYKRTPLDTSGMVQVAGTLDVRVCPQCKEEDIKADHFKSIGKTRLKGGETEGPCCGLHSNKQAMERLLWARPIPFKVSKTSLTRYQDVVGHRPITDRKKGTTTFDITAVQSLATKYPTDPLYPLLGDFRQTQKLLGTYVGVTDVLSRSFISGWACLLVADGRVHTLFTHNPSTSTVGESKP